MKKSLTQFPFYLAVTIFLFTYGCTKVDVEEEEPEIPINNDGIVQTSEDVKSLQVVSITLNRNLLEKYPASFGNTQIELAKTADNELSFVVPDVAPGNHFLVFGSSKIRYKVSKTQVTNATTLVDNLFKDFDKQVANMSDTSAFERQQIAELNEYKKEVLRLFNLLTDAQKQQTAMFYEANKSVFKDFLQKASVLSLSGSNTIARSTYEITDCKTTTNNAKDFYGCKANNIAIALTDLKAPMAEITKLAAAAGIFTLLAPASLGLSAFGANVSMGIALYIFMAEVLPKVKTLMGTLRSFLWTNWIFGKNLFLAVKEEFISDSDEDLELQPSLRSVTSADQDINPGTSFFINTLTSVSDVWNKFAAIFGSLPSFANTESPVTLSPNDVVISNVSNPGVQLVSQTGQKVKFKTLSRFEEFHYQIKVSKNGFDIEGHLSGSISGAPPFKKGFYQVMYNWESFGNRIMLESLDGFRGNVLYPGEDGWMDFGYKFTCYYLNESSVKVNIFTGGCLSEEFIISNFDNRNTSFTGRYTTARCHHSDDIGSEVSIQYFGTSL